MRLAGRIACHYGLDVIVLVDALLLGAVQQWTVAVDDGPYNPEVAPIEVAPIDVAPTDVAPTVPQSSSARTAVSRLLTHLGVPEAGVEQFLRRAPVVGGDSGDVLLAGWGATRGAVEEAVQRLRAKGVAVSSVHLTSLSPVPPGLGPLLRRFKRVVAIDVLTELFDAKRRVHHLHTLLRGASYADPEKPIIRRPALGAHLFPYAAPLTPASVERFVKGLTDTPSLLTPTFAP